MAQTATKRKAAAPAPAPATAKPRQASATKAKVAEVAKPTKKAASKGIGLVEKVEERKKAKTAAAKATATKAAAKQPVAAAEVVKKQAKAAPKKEKVVAISQSTIVSREVIEQVAYLKWVERGRQHGYALEDWIRAEQELLDRAS